MSARCRSSAGSRERPSAAVSAWWPSAISHRRARCEVRFVRGQARHPSAVISPYVIAKIAETHARALFLTGERFDAERALRIGLVHRVVDDVDAAVAESINQPEDVRPRGRSRVQEA